MRLEHTFTVPVPVEEAWKVLLDLPRVAPCMPGATLTGVEGAEFTGNVKVRLGPIALTYQGKGRFVERDEAARRVVIEASGKDVRSAGTASATVTASLDDQGDSTKVQVVTELTVTGRPAQFGRGMIAEVSAKLIGQFADCLARTVGPALAGPSDPAAPGAPAGSAAVAGPAERTGPGGPGKTDGPGASAGPGGAAPAPTASTTATAESPVAEPTTPVAGTVTAAEAGEVEPIDLLRLTGGTAAGRRLALYGLGGLLLMIVVWLTVRRRRRSHDGA